METPLPFLGEVYTPTPVMVSAVPPHTLKPGPGEAEGWDWRQGLGAWGLVHTVA